MDINSNMMPSCETVNQTTMAPSTEAQHTHGEECVVAEAVKKIADEWRASGENDDEFYEQLYDEGCAMEMRELYEDLAECDITPQQSVAITEKLRAIFPRPNAAWPECIECDEKLNPDSHRSYLLGCGWLCKACMKGPHSKCAECFPCEDSEEED